MHASDTVRDKKKGATDDLASSEADFVKDLFEPSIMAVAERVKAKMRDTSTATQRATVSRNGATRTIGERPRTLRYDTQNHDKTRVTPSSAIWPWMHIFSGFCVTRYARGAVGITQFRAAFDRDYTKESVPLVETILFKIIVDCRLGGDSTKGDTAWDKGISLGVSERNHKHFVGSKHGVMAARTVRRLEP